MDAVTYPKAEVIRFINGRLIPLRVPSNSEPHAATFNVQWTPTLVTLDVQGKEHYRTVGFLPPEELIPSLLLGIAKVHFDAGRYDEALSHLGEILAQYPQSGAAPEAIYLEGVSRYKATSSPQPLKEAYGRLKTQHPSSEWTKRAFPYSLL